jgi:hypothetical protein
MATYLQGVTDYIPEFQPFQPDLNFYANVMQTKQSQYDSNWKSLNKMYGQYFYADLTRDGNIKKKDELLKNMEFNLKRVSQLDLSLEQNVNQATQVFKPFYEDKNLMKDMAWTKNFNSQVGRAQALQGSAEEDRRKQFWDTGLRELQYKKDEFKAADDATAMSFGNVAYTPYVNSVELAQKIAKDAGLSIETVDFSPDQKWIVTTKNGEKLREPLSKLFEARLGSDPQVQAVYKTQAYVNRKDYAYSNAAQFNGDKNAAEMKYLENSFNILKEQNKQRYVSVQDRSKVYDTKIKEIEKSIANKTAAPTAEKTLKEYQQAKEINDKILERVEKENNEFNKTSSSTPSTSTGFVNPYGDINSLRYKVDAGMAGMLMSKDLNEAAEIFAYKDFKVNVKENPYKVLDIKHAQAMQQVHARGSYSVRAASIRAQGAVTAAKIRNAGELETLKTSEGLKMGYLKPQPRIDPRTGQMARDQAGNPIVDIVPNENEVFEYRSKVGVADGEVNPAERLNNAQERKTQVFQAAGNQLSIALKKYREMGLITDEQIDEMLNPGDLMQKKKGPSRYDKVLGDYVEKRAVGTEGDYRKDDYIDYDPQLRGFKAKRVTLDNLGSLTAEEVYNLQKTFNLQDSRLFNTGVSTGPTRTVSQKVRVADPNAKDGYRIETRQEEVPVYNKDVKDTRNYFTAVIDNLESYINDNYDVPFINQTAPAIKNVLMPAKMESYVNADIEDWKYQTRVAMAEEIPFADQLFDENNNLLSKEALRSIASKAIYDEYPNVESKQGFFESVMNTFSYYTGNKELNPETMKYWKSWGDYFTKDDQAPGPIKEAFLKYGKYVLPTLPGGIQLQAAGAATNLLQKAGLITPPPKALKDAAYIALLDNLESAYDKVFTNATNSEWYKNKGLANMPTFSILNEGGTGFASTGSGIEVLPQAPGTKGFQAFHGLASDFRRIPSFDGKESAILFGNLEGISGTEKSALDDTDTAVSQTRKGQAILQALFSQASLPNNDLKPFTIVAQNIAGGSYDKGAMIVMPDPKWLEQFKSTDEKNTNNLLTKDEYNSILQNGLSVISNVDNFSNSLMGSTYKTALENIVDYRGYYEETVPGGGKVRIDKGTGVGVSDYITSTTFDAYDPQTKETLKGMAYDSFAPKSRELPLFLKNQIDLLNQNRELNVQANNGYFDENY